MTNVLMMGLRRLDVGHLANVLVMNLARSLRDLPRRLLDDVAGGQTLLKRLLVPALALTLASAFNQPRGRRVLSDLLILRLCLMNFLLAPHQILFALPLELGAQRLVLLWRLRVLVLSDLLHLFILARLLSWLSRRCILLLDHRQLLVLLLSQRVAGLHC